MNTVQLQKVSEGTKTSTAGEGTPHGSGLSALTASEVRLAVHSDANVLLLGATGTGKSTLAFSIHQKSRRSQAPFVTVNLASLHEGTLESELFGHERGAFTGALSARKGKLEMAHGGTVFLDEIGDLSLPLQARLLEFLQERKVTPLGSHRERILDVRVIAATHRDLSRQVQEGTFREDLYHRLRVIEIRLPGLKQGQVVLDELVHQLLEKISIQYQKIIHSLSAEVAALIEEYPWPGNIRELKNVLEYAVISAEDARIEMRDLPQWFLHRGCQTTGPSGEQSSGRGWRVAEVAWSNDYAETLARFERQYLQEALLRSQGRVNLTARRIQINKTTLIRKLRAHQLTGAGAALSDDAQRQ